MRSLSPETSRCYCSLAIKHDIQAERRHDAPQLRYQHVLLESFEKRSLPRVSEGARPIDSRSSRASRSSIACNPASRNLMKTGTYWPTTSSPNWRGWIFTRIEVFSNLPHPIRGSVTRITNGLGLGNPSCS